MPATLDIDVSSYTNNEHLYRYHRKQIRLRNTGNRPRDRENLASWNTDAERCFVRINQWVPAALTGPFGATDPGVPHPGLNTDPNPNFTIGDSWIADMNNRKAFDGVTPRPVALWCTHENLALTTWFPGSVLAGTPNAGHWQLYEDTLYEILRYLHFHFAAAGNRVMVFEPLNEPEIAKNGPDATPNGRKWTSAQQYEMLKVACRAIHRVNTEFGLTGDDRILTSAPHWTEAALTNQVVQYQTTREYLDLAAQDTNVTTGWDAVVKPILGWWAIHGFQNKSIQDRKLKDFAYMDNYIATSTGTSANRDILTGIPRALTAYNRDGELENHTYNVLDSVRHAAFFAATSKHFNDYRGPADERIEQGIMFAQANYNDYSITAISPHPLAINPQPSYGNNDGIKTTVGNAYWLLDKLGDNDEDTCRLSVVGSGSVAWEVLNDDTWGVTCEAAHTPGSTKVSALVVWSMNENATDASEAVTINFNNIDAALALTSDFVIRVWKVDKDGGTTASYAAGGARLVSTTTRPQGSVLSDFVVGPLTIQGPSIYLIEVEGQTSNSEPPIEQPNQVLLDWNNNVEVDLQDYEYLVESETTDPDVRRAIVIAPTSQVVLTDLAEDVKYNAKVRARNTDLEWSDWSATISFWPGTPGGSGPSVPGPSGPGPSGPGPDPGRISHGTGKLLANMTTHGPKLGRIPKQWSTSNLSRTAGIQELVGGLVNQATAAYNAWEAAVNLDPALHTFGPRCMITVPLSLVAGNAKQTSATLTDSNNYKSYQALKKMADGFYAETVFAEAARRIKALTVGGFTDWPARYVIRLGHEHNIPAFPWYSGIDSQLIGTIPASLDPEGIGDRGPTYAQAFRVNAEAMRAIDDRFVFDCNFAHPGADPEGSGGALQRFWFPPEKTLATMTSWPGADVVDVIGCDYYCRGEGRLSGVGSNLRFFTQMHQDLGALHNRPLSFPEFGVTIHNDPLDPHVEAGTDLQAAAWLDYMFNHVNSVDLAYATYWASTRIDMDSGAGYNYRPTATTAPNAWAVIQDWFPAR